MRSPYVQVGSAPIRATSVANACSNCSLQQTCPVGTLPVSEYEREELMLREMPIHKGEPLSHQGSIPRDLVVVKVGQALISRRTLSQSNRAVALVRPGASFGYDGLLHEESAFSATGSTLGRACRVHLSDLQALSNVSLRVRQHLDRHALHFQGLLWQWLDVLGHTSVRTRVVACIFTLADSTRGTLVQLPPQAVLAEMLGSSRESIARTMRLLETERCIRKAQMGRYEIFPERLLAMQQATPDEGEF